MSPGDLAFLLALLLTVGGTCRILYCVARGRRGHAGRLLGRLGTFVAAYLAALLAVSALQPTRIVALGEPQCFDEWCVVVDGATREHAIAGTAAQGDFILVAAHTQNRGRGRPQREVDVHAVLRDNLDRRFALSSRGVAAYRRATGDRSALTDSIDAGQSRAVSLVYDVPRASRGLELMIRHGWFPHAVIIGDPEGLLHRATVVPMAVP